MNEARQRSIIAIITVAHEWTTDGVIDWLLHMGKGFIRINMDNLDRMSVSLSVNSNHTNLCISNNHKWTVDKDEITNVWFRRTKLNIDIDLSNIVDEGVQKTIRSNLIVEKRFFEHSIFHLLNDKKWLNHYKTVVNDKLETLILAKNCGLRIPSTVITNNLSELVAFKNKHNSIITKPIHNIVDFTFDGVTYLTYTALVQDTDLESVGYEIFPSLCQECLDKLYEIRSFYLDGRFYSMAIFSQNDEQTKIDFRRYNYENPNRRVPYKLPEDIESKARLLMQKSNLNCGSIDFVKSKSGELFFLEVNPVGQFSMTSEPCNYFLEKEVALFLSKSDLNG